MPALPVMQLVQVDASESEQEPLIARSWRVTTGKTAYFLGENWYIATKMCTPSLSDDEAVLNQFSYVPPSSFGHAVTI